MWIFFNCISNVCLFNKKNTYLCFPDCLCCPNPNILFRLPSCNSSHLWRTERVNARYEPIISLHKQSSVNCHPLIANSISFSPSYSRSRKRMMNVSYVSFFAMFLMYLLAALFGYLTFYGKYRHLCFLLNNLCTAKPQYYF